LYNPATRFKSGRTIFALQSKNFSNVIAACRAKKILAEFSTGLVEEMFLLMFLQRVTDRLNFFAIVVTEMFDLLKRFTHCFEDAEARKKIDLLSPSC